MNTENLGSLASTNITQNGNLAQIGETNLISFTLNQQANVKFEGSSFTSASTSLSGLSGSFPAVRVVYNIAEDTNGNNVIDPNDILITNDPDPRNRQLAATEENFEFFNEDLNAGNYLIELESRPGSIDPTSAIGDVTYELNIELTPLDSTNLDTGMGDDSDSTSSDDDSNSVTDTNTDVGMDTGDSDSDTNSDSDSDDGSDVNNNTTDAEMDIDESETDLEIETEDSTDSEADNDTDSESDTDTDAEMDTSDSATDTDTDEDTEVDSDSNGDLSADDSSADTSSFETIDLTNFGDQSINFTLTREAAYNNTVDFYPVADANGSVVDSDTNTNIAPGEDGYADAAIANRLGLDISTENGVTSEFTAQFTGGTIYAPLIAVNSDFSAFSDGDANNDPPIYFTYEAVNIDEFDHVKGMTNSQFAFEDLPKGGNSEYSEDLDFNDIILDFELVANEPTEEEPEVEEPVDETPTDDTEEPEVDEPEVEEPMEEPVDEDPVMEEPETEEPMMEEPEGDGSISGLKFNDSNGSEVRDSDLVQGENPDIVFVFDVSGSTNRTFQGISVNEDGSSSSIFEAELAAFIGLNQQLIDRGLGDSVDVGVVAFGSRGVQVDLDPVTDGLQLTTTPSTDLDGNGVSDIEEVLSNDKNFFSSPFSLNAGSTTNYESSLQVAEDIFNTLGTEPSDGNLVFLSDGDNNGGPYEDEVASLNDLSVNLSAFGVGESSSLEDLQIIDPDARIFTSTDEILNVFADLNSDADGDGEVDGGGSQSTLEEVVPGITIYIDLDNDGELDGDEPSQVTDENGEYIFEGLATGTYTVREVTPDGFTSTTGESTITLGEGEAIEGVDFGNISDEELAMLNVESDM